MIEVVGSQKKMSKFKLPADTDGVQPTGERFHLGQRGEIKFEHYHRYLFAAQLCNDRDVLDVACGEGYGGFLLSQAARSVVGVDIDTTIVPNSFHLLELTKSEFQIVLFQQFSFREMVVQKKTGGSVVLPAYVGLSVVEILEELWQQ